MTEIARRNADNTALVQRRLTEQQIRLAVAEVTGQIVLGDIGGGWTDELLDEAELVRVTPVAAPAADYGERVVEDEAAEKVGDVWQQKWTVVQNGTVAEVKARAAAEVSGIVSEKIDSLLENQGVAKVVLRLLLFADFNLFKVDASTDPAVHPMMDAYRLVTGTPPAQVVAAIDTLRLAWMNRARTLLIGEASALAAITAATTLAQIKAAVLAARDL